MRHLSFRKKVLSALLTLLLVGGSSYLSIGANRAEAADDCIPQAEVCDGVDNNCNGLIDEGDNWTKVLSTLQLNSSSGLSASPMLAVDASGNTHVVWQGSGADADPYSTEIYYSKFNSQGIAVLDNVELTSSGGNSSSPSLAVDNAGGVHVTWLDGISGEMYYAKLNGTTPVSGTSLNSATGFNVGVRMAADNAGNVHIVWAHTGTEPGATPSLYYTKLDNTGTTVVDDVEITSAGSDGYAWAPRLEVDGSGNVHIAWTRVIARKPGEMGPNNQEIYYTKLNNNGGILVADTRLTSNSTVSKEPSLALDNAGNVHVAWSDIAMTEVGPIREIFYSKLDNNGATILDDLRITSAMMVSDAPSLAVDASGNVHIAWEDFRDTLLEVYYTKLNNNGVTLIDDTRITFNSPESNSLRFPELALDPTGQMHVVWAGLQEVPDYVANVYYTRAANSACQGNVYYRDADGDGYGNPDASIQSLESVPPAGYVSNRDDCQDTRADVYPGAPELCDGVDNDCNGLVDDGVNNTYYLDADHDGHGNPASTVQGCLPPYGYVSTADDCNDGNAQVYPGAPEVCDGVDNDCNGIVDEGFALHPTKHRPMSLSSKATASQVALRWRDRSANEGGFIIERKDGACGSKAAWEIIATTLANVTTYVDNGVAANKLYSYRVKAVTCTAETNYSNCNTVRTRRK